MAHGVVALLPWVTIIKTYKQTHTMKEFRIVASRVSNYIAYVEANDESEAEALALQSDTDWQFLDDDADYQVYTVEEAE